MFAKKNNGTFRWNFLTRTNLAKYGRVTVRGKCCQQSADDGSSRNRPSLCIQQGGREAAVAARRADPAAATETFRPPYTAEFSD